MSDKTELRVGDRVRVIQAGSGKQVKLGPTVYQVNLIDGHKVMIAELKPDGTCYASQESDVSLLALADDEARQWFVVVGNNCGWGRSKRSARQAVLFMQQNGITAATAWTVWKCSEATEVDGFGNLVYPSGDPRPVCVRRHNTKEA